MASIENMEQLGSYNSDGSKWEAYQFSDPFATSSFICGNKRLHIACRPNCDHYPKVTARDDFEMFEDASQAYACGYKMCQYCDASNPETQLDLPLIKMTIDSINHSIGFTNDTNDLKRRAYSVPSVSPQRSGYSADRQLTRNESEHIKLVELACRHIASAAASSMNKQEDDTSVSKKKRRGGILGFKELASKSKLSPWHFHRVFKSVTGLTPKSYGDQCWKFIKDRERPRLTERQRSHFKSNQEITKNFKKPKTAISKRKSGKEVSSPRSGGPSSELSPLSTSQGLTNSASDIQQYPSATGFNFETNKNTLDINVTPFRHHSLDLGSLNFDFSDFNVNILSNLSPQFVSLDQFSQSFQAQQQQQQQQNLPQQDTQHPVQQQHQVPQYNTFQPQFQPQEQQHQQSILPVEQPLQAVGSQIITYQSTPTNESQWATLGALTPDTAGSRLFTPPSSVSENDFKTENPMSSTGSASSTEPFYDAVKNSPLGGNEFESGDNYSLVNDGDNFFDIINLNDELMQTKQPAVEPMTGFVDYLR